MKEKKEVIYYSDVDRIDLTKKIGLVPALVFGCLGGLIFGSLVYESYRYGVGIGVRTMIDAYKDGKLGELDTERE